MDGAKVHLKKILESYNDVFSDIVNVLLFNGKQVLLADELEDQAPRSYYKVDGKIREIERDVAKRWRNGNIRVACIGFENQTASDPICRSVSWVTMAQSTGRSCLAIAKISILL